MFLVGGIAVVLGMATVLWWALKHGRAPFWFFGISNSRAERPVLYWLQIAGYAATLALVAFVVGAFALAAFQTETLPGAL